MHMTDGDDGAAGTGGGGAPAEAPSAAAPPAPSTTVPVVRVGNKRRASTNGGRKKRAKIWMKEVQELIVQIEAMLEWSTMYFESAQLVTYRYVHMVCTFHMYIPHVHTYVCSTSPKNWEVLVDYYNQTPCVLALAELVETLVVRLYI